MSVDDLNRFFTWHRAAGQPAPIGHFTPQNDISGACFSYILANTLTKNFTDIDGVTGGLNFSSAILDANPDPTIRQDGKISPNDLIMAYVIYKLYGSSANPTMNVIYNLQDAYNMLPTSTLIRAIEDSLNAEEASSSSGAVNDMFQDLLSGDPTRFFDATGKQIPGLFEVNSRDSAKGSWNFVENDRIELNVQFTFVNSVTINSTSGDSENINSTVVIPSGKTFKIRLQLLATNTPTAAAAIQEAYVAATVEELARQVTVQKDIVQNTADALAVATQAISAAQAQTAAEKAKYNSAVTRSAQQQKLVLAAQAALQAAQSALEAARVSGNQANIQQQNAAAIAAQALLVNQQAIADVASTELENAATALAKATATLNAAQSAAARASAAQAAATQAAANASLALEISKTATLASTIASATAASDPLTQSLQAEQDAILDPQNLAIILAKANAATNSRKTSFNVATQSFANQTSQLNTYNSLIYMMNTAIATGSNVSQIQLSKAMVIGASNAVNTSLSLAKTAASTLAASYTAELTAIHKATLASSNAASLSATLATANTNSANRSLTAATTTYVYASTMNANAASAAAEAQAILNNRVSNGAVMSEVQTRTQALLTANSVYAAATSTMNGALVKMTIATKAYQAASTIAVDAKTHISSVSASNLFTLTQYQASVSSSSAYQANVLSNAQLNQLAAQVNTSLINLNAANDMVARAQASVSIAQTKITLALSQGATLPEITVLKGAYSVANDALTQALLIQATAQADYNNNTQNAANGQVQLLQADATAYFNASITQQQLANDNITYYSLLVNYATQHPTAFPSASVYPTQLSIWKTYLSDYQKLSESLLTQFKTDMIRTSALMEANPSISTALGSLSNYYIANSNSSHIVFQVNGITSLLTSLSNVGLNPPDLESDLANYSSQSNAALATTSTAYNTFLADLLSAQSISLVSSVGQVILNTAAKFQLAQISSATMNTNINIYNSTKAEVSMIQLEYDQAAADVAVAKQALSNASKTGTPPGQLTILQQRYANSTASLATLANKLGRATQQVSTMAGQFGITDPKYTSKTVSSPVYYQVPSVPGLQLWLDAKDPLGNESLPTNGARLTVWTDKSGNGRNGFVPSSNQHHTCDPYVTYVASNSSVAMSNGTVVHSSIPPGTFSNAFNMFMVYTTTDSTPYNALVSRCSSTFEANWPNPIFVSGNTTQGVIQICEVNNTGGIVVNSGVNSYSWTPYNTTLNMVNLDIDFSRTNVNIMINGNVVDTQTYSDITNDLGDTVTIGGRTDAYSYGNINVNEVMLFNTELTDPQRQQVEGYLAWKWGLQTQLPTTHPYFLSYPTIGPPPTIKLFTNPTTIPGAQLWLDASDPLGDGSVPSNGASITTWYDKSLNAYNAIATGSPVLQTGALNSLPGIAFVGNTGPTIYYTAAIPPRVFSNATTFFVVYNNTADNGNNSLLTRSFLGNNIGNPDINNDSITITNSSSPYGYNGYGITSLYNTSPSLFELSIDQVGNAVHQWITGTAQGIIYQGYGPLTPSTADANNDGIYIGTRGDNGTSFQGVFYEIIAYNTVLSTSERQTVEGYLAWKWGLQGQLPSGHPYISAAPIFDTSISDSIYSIATSLRQAELAVAKKNELVQQANTTFNTFSQLNDKLQAATQSTNTVLDEISLALANGSKISEIQPLEDQLASLQKYISLTQFDAQNMYNTFITLSTLVTPDASFISTVNTNASTLYTATLNSRLNESAQQVETKQVEELAAKTALQKSQASLVLMSTQMETALQQGLGFAQLAPLKSSLEAAYLDVSNKTVFLDYTIASLTQAKSKYHSLYTTPDIYSVFMNNSTNIATQFSTLTQSQIYQSTSINSAMNNVLTANLTNAFMGFLNYSTQTVIDSANYSTLRIQYDTQISQGSNVNQLSNLLDKINKASLQYSLDTQYTEQYSAAYISSLILAREDPAAKAILIRVAANETAVIEGAKTNTLYNNLMSAQEKLFLVNGAFINAQAEYNVANSDIQIATTNGCSADALTSKLSTLGGRGKELSEAQIKLTLATNAVQQANSYVNMNSNSMTILNSATTQYTLQTAAAQANALYAQYSAAAENEAKTYAAVQDANSALESAKRVFNSSIQAGLDISTIQGYRNAVTVAGEYAAEAAFNQTNAKNALNVAIQNADIDQIAQSLIITARLENENTTAGGSLNSAQAELNTLSTNVAAELIALNLAKVSNRAAVSTLEYSVSPSLESYSLQFVNNLYNITATGINNTTVSNKTITFISKQVEINGNDMDYKYIMFSAAEPNANFYIRIQDPGDTQDTIPWIMFNADNTFSIIDPQDRATYYAAEAYTTSNVFVIHYDDIIRAFLYYKDNVLLYSFPYNVSNRMIWRLLNWLEYSVITILYAGMAPPGAGMTRQESVDIQSAVNATTSTLNSAQLAFNSAILDFNAEASLVSSLTQKFSTTTAVLTLNNYNNTLLYNGFVYNQTTGTYALSRSALPRIIQNGVPFNLYSFSVTPINLGTYNPLTPYVIGNLVYYPNYDGAQYMCALSPFI
jgi:hypothetical protein